MFPKAADAFSTLSSLYSGTSIAAKERTAIDHGQNALPSTIYLLRPYKYADVGAMHYHQRSQHAFALCTTLEGDTHKKRCSKVCLITRSRLAALQKGTRWCCQSGAHLSAVSKDETSFGSSSFCQWAQSISGMSCKTHTLVLQVAILP